MVGVLCRRAVSACLLLRARLTTLRSSSVSRHVRCTTGGKSCAHHCPPLHVDAPSIGLFGSAWHHLLGAVVRHLFACGHALLAMPCGVCHQRFRHTTYMCVKPNPTRVVFLACVQRRRGGWPWPATACGVGQRLIVSDARCDREDIRCRRPLCRIARPSDACCSPPGSQQGHECTREGKRATLQRSACSARRRDAFRLCMRCALVVCRVISHSVASLTTRS